MKFKLFFLFLSISCQILFIQKESFGQTTYYISSSQGNDSNNGKSQTTPWKSINKVNSSTFNPGDQILFKRGDQFTESLIVPSGGTLGDYLQISSYGNGNLPIIGSSNSPWTTNTTYGIICNKSYIQISDIVIIQPYSNSLKRGYALTSDYSHDITLSNIYLDGTHISSPYDLYGIEFSNCTSGIQIQNCEINGFVKGIALYSSNAIVDDCFIHNAYQSGNTNEHGIAIQAQKLGDFFDHQYKTIIKNCEFTQWGESAIDGLGSYNYIIENNNFHDPKTFSEGFGISTGCNRGTIIRYNWIHDLNSTNSTNQNDDGSNDYNINAAINVRGAKTLEIYYNLITNVGNAFQIDRYTPSYYPNEPVYDPSGLIKIYNNTVLARYAATWSWDGPAPVVYKNNILQGNVYSIKTSTSRQPETGTTGSGNIINGNILNTGGGTYNHIPGEAVDQFNIDQKIIFLNASTQDYRLKTGSPAIQAGVNLGLKDILGNLISGKPDIGAIQYGTSFSKQSSGLKIFLEGCYENGSMTIDLNNQNIIPLSQPYVTAPWNYTGDENVAIVAPNIVDWVLVELRKAPDAASRVARQAAFINSNGMVLNFSGNDNLSFNNVADGDYFIVIIQRNHLAVMSAKSVSLSNGIISYDFTTGEDKAYGSNAMAELGNNVFGMYGGDSDSNGIIDDKDVNDVGNNLFKINYLAPDSDLNSKINVIDYKLPKKNLGKKTYVTGIFSL